MVQLRERLDRDTIAIGERDEGIAALHTIARRCALACEHLRGDEALHKQLIAPLRAVRR